MAKPEISGSVAVQLDHFGSSPQYVQVIRPSLYHFAACRQVCRAIAGAPVGGIYRMRQLVLDQVNFRIGAEREAVLLAVCLAVAHAPNL